MVTTCARWSRRCTKRKQIKDGPVIVHALTTKGKGHPAAEERLLQVACDRPVRSENGQADQIVTRARRPTRKFSAKRSAN